MSNNIFEKMTNQMHETVDSAVALALHNKNQEVKNTSTLGFINKYKFSIKSTN